ncbi:hypothetical protein BX265_8430 [Streptomyces sp. TLI_235]|nr:hypothetical protein [Streptomyces sp. TLI_235]PBC66215.1 hypothetical protein BX265_8430 [Streptomyces sp. TLI_235]
MTTSRPAGVDRRPWAVFDIDGVVADPRHRVHHLNAARPDWDAFFADAGGDFPLRQGITLARRYARDHAVLWLTGRPEKTRAATTAWLARQGLPTDHLIMRPDDFEMAAGTLKAARLTGLAEIRRVAVVFDDDTSVVTALRAAGWPVTRADWAPGPGAALFGPG